MPLKKVFLKPGKEKSILVNRHPWIFSGAVDKIPSFTDGEVMSVHGHGGDFLALAYFHSKTSIAGRILSFDNDSVEAVIEKRLKCALALRRSLVCQDTDCYRLINAEGDGLPGLIVDCYRDVFVLQVHTLGMERLKPLIVEKLLALLQPRSLYEKSLSSARELEGLPPQEGVLFGPLIEEIEVKENNIRFIVPITKGQKTGLFLDQREMRKNIGALSFQKRVLNCFSYTGGFSLYALQGNADKVTSVDIGEVPCEYARKNSELNGFSEGRHAVIQADVFDFLAAKETIEEDIVILDPPAFAKKRKDIDSASTGYRKLNYLALHKMRPGALLLTSSCSYFMERGLFQQILFQAASDAKRNVRILQGHIAALDHPISLFHPEGEYLKSFLLYVD